MFGHPLGLNLPEQGPHQIRREEAYGVMPAGVDPTLRFPKRHGEHNWMIVLTCPTEAEHLLAGAFQFRGFAMADCQAHCWVCERDWDPNMAEGPCLGDPRGVDIPTRAEWRAWTDEEKTAWLERLSSSR